MMLQTYEVPPSAGCYVRARLIGDGGDTDQPGAHGLPSGRVTGYRIRQPYMGLWITNRFLQ